MRTFVWILGAALSFSALPVKAEVSQGLPLEIKSTRVLIEGKQRQSYWTVKNHGKNSYAYTVLTFDTNQRLEQGNRSKSFLVTPPTGLLKPNEEKTFRIVRVGDDLPKDRESMALLRLKLLPSGQSQQQADQARIQSLMSIYLKLFYRPESLNQERAVELATTKLAPTCQGNTLTLQNSSAYWLTLDSLFVDQTDIISNHEKAPMIAPQSNWSRLVQSCPSFIQVSSIKENGLPTELQLLKVEELK